MDQGDLQLEIKDRAILLTVCAMSDCLYCVGDVREPMINLLRSQGSAAAPAEGDGGPTELDLITQFKAGFQYLGLDQDRANWFFELHTELLELQPEEHKRVQYLEILYKIFLESHPQLTMNEWNDSGEVDSDSDTYSNLDSVPDIDSDSDKENIYAYTNNNILPS